MSAPYDLLWPRPQRLLPLSGHLTLPQRPTLAPGPWADALRPGARLRRRLRTTAAGRLALTEDTAVATLRLVAEPALAHSEAYHLTVHPSGALLAASGERGIEHGLDTWLGLLESARSDRLPGLRIEDWPDFDRRGVMLDVSRNKVPTMQTLEEIVELLARCRLNELQLYTEHTFAYAGHEAIWKGSSPLTAEEIRTLDSACAERGIDLVPNQNSFGHFHRWLRHDDYRHLAECPQGVEHPFSLELEPFSLCATEPRVLDLLADLYDQLLPNFSSDRFNVGLDETFDLGKGRSAEACAATSRSRVYLDFVRAVHGLVSERGRRMLMWGDIVLEHPELLDRLPADTIALLWGYEADHPFRRECGLAADSGLTFYVCPGTSSWNSLGGRLDNALGNLQSAARAGKAAGAEGLLITDWGDFGHLQPLPVSWPGIVAGAGLAWNAAATVGDEQLTATMQALGLASPELSRCLFRLGRVYQRTGLLKANRTVLFEALIFAHEALAKRRLDTLGAAEITATRDEIGAIADAIERAPGAGAGAELVRAELAWVASALALSAELLQARLDSPESPLDRLPAGRRSALAAGVESLDDRLEGVWLPRYRSGGLSESRAYLRRVAALLA